MNDVDAWLTPARLLTLFVSVYVSLTVAGWFTKRSDP